MRYLLIISLILGLYGCKSNASNEFEHVSLDASLDSISGKNLVFNDSVYLIIKNKGSVHPLDTIQIEIINNTDTLWTTGQSYKIEKKIDNGWSKVQLGPGVFYDIGYEIQSYKSRLFEIDLSDTRKPLSCGTYRISKVITSEGKERIISDEIDIQ